MTTMSFIPHMWLFPINYDSPLKIILTFNSFKHCVFTIKVPCQLSQIIAKVLLAEILG